ncbi:Beta-galactosidase [Aphelenchoides besseyi]|nr:Beta-galactosidase [Aphelenchoides besseyi]KAI6198634.1 Beta-galactosidase [Aphelenchoides besseyi]
MKLYGLIVIVLLSLLNGQNAQERGVKVNCEKNQFELDGKPFRYISGEIHYFRIPRQLWNDRLQRMRAMGLNVAQVYVAWNWHEEQEEVYNFEGDRNLREFLKLAADNQLFVNLRMGPYACAEWEQGGLPWWLLNYPNIELRSSKEPFLGLAKKWMKRLVEEVQDLQYPDGPIILAQVENEYSSYGCDHEYMSQLTSAMKEYGMNRTLAYTTDPPVNLPCGCAEGAYPTVDFGVNSQEQVSKNFAKQREIAKCGPYVNSEFYTGWYDSWNHSHTGYPSSKEVSSTMDHMLKYNASFSFYMAHGGTNFGFWNGAETDSFIIQSYDYGSPITESGQITEKYLAIQNHIKKLDNWPNQPLSVPQNHSSFAFTKLSARRLNGSLVTLLSKVKQNCKTVNEPENFEKFNQSYGYAIYSTDMPMGVTPKKLYIKFLRDLAYVFIGDEYQGWLGDCTIDVCFKSELQLNPKADGKLRIVVENLGRLNFGIGKDYKGIRSSVYLNDMILTNWEECGVNSEKLPSMVDELAADGPTAFAPENAPSEPGIYLSVFKLDHQDLASDVGVHTFFDPINWGKGQLFLNNVNVGRYWPSAGPQRTVFVPGVFFDLTGKTDNKLVLVNFEPRAPVGNFDFVGNHIWNSSSNYYYPTFFLLFLSLFLC